MANSIAKEPQYSPHKHRTIDYVSNKKIVQPADTSPSLDDKGIKRVQIIVDVLLYVGRAVKNKLIVALSATGSQKAAATEKTADMI